tara:strand:+ start:161 stop:502 length:342 start_codon:yes stop_codon:yes gene_type:complete
MTRLIDTMTGAEVRGRLSPFFDGTCCYEDLDAWLTEELENLFAEEPQWFDKLDPTDDQSWVLCYLSDDSPEDRRRCAWVMRHNGCVYMTSRLNGCWKYATPVDLNVRFRKGDD